MSKFKRSEANIQGEIKLTGETRVVKLEMPALTGVKPFTAEKIRRKGQSDYAATKARYGPLAATDSDRSVRSRKDARFSINPLLRGPLAVDEEERRAIEERVRERVGAVVEESRAKAELEGREEGRKQGYREAFEEFRAQGMAALARFEAFVTECEAAKERVFKANERFLVELVYRIARMLLLRELTTDRDYVLRLARDLIERVGVRENITIRISREDMDIAERLREGLEKALGAFSNLNIEASTQVKQGGCLIETAWNAIDASIETQLQGAHEALVGGAKRS